MVLKLEAVGHKMDPGGRQICCILWNMEIYHRFYAIKHQKNKDHQPVISFVLDLIKILSLGLKVLIWGKQGEALST